MAFECAAGPRDAVEIALTACRSSVEVDYDSPRVFLPDDGQPFKMADLPVRPCTSTTKVRSIVDVIMGYSVNLDFARLQTEIHNRAYGNLPPVFLPAVTPTNGAHFKTSVAAVLDSDNNYNILKY